MVKGKSLSAIDADFTNRADEDYRNLIREKSTQFEIVSRFKKQLRFLDLIFGEQLGAMDHEEKGPALDAVYAAMYAQAVRLHDLRRPMALHADITSFEEDGAGAGLTRLDKELEKLRSPPAVPIITSQAVGPGVSPSLPAPAVERVPAKKVRSRVSAVNDDGVVRSAEGFVEFEPCQCIIPAGGRSPEESERLIHVRTVNFRHLPEGPYLARASCPYCQGRGERPRRYDNYGDGVGLIQGTSSSGSLPTPGFKPGSVPAPAPAKKKKKVRESEDLSGEVQVPEMG